MTLYRNMAKITVDMKKAIKFHIHNSKSIYHSMYLVKLIFKVT